MHLTPKAYENSAAPPQQVSYTILFKALVLSVMAEIGHGMFGLSRSEAKPRYSPELSHVPLSRFLPSRLCVPSALRLSGATASFAVTLQSHKAPLPCHLPLFILFFPNLFSFFSISCPSFPSHLFPSLPIFLLTLSLVQEGKGSPASKP